MRAELETIASIEKYLLKELSEVEINQFETRMATDPTFKNDVELQTQLMQSLERISLQQSIAHAQKTYQFWKLLKLIGIILIPIIIVLSAWYFMRVSDASAEIEVSNETIPTKVVQPKYEKQTPQKETTKTLMFTPDTIRKKKKKKKTLIFSPKASSAFTDDVTEKPLESIPSEVFSIVATKDTIIESQNGIVFFIPKNTFVDSANNVVTENVTLEIKEAVTAATIMTSGLATLHNDKPLETGGMFFMEARKDGEKLQIHPEKEIIADIPTQDYKSDMQLFDGEVTADGIINWVNPKPLNNDLIPQDIFSLNFYPPNYLQMLKEKGYDTTDKQFTDSLYYSFSLKKEVPKVKRNRIRNGESPNIIRVLDTVKSDQTYISNIRDEVTTKTGLDPLKVKTIWNERYQNTFIATKAFEERLRVIHANCASANSIFDVYAQNLDRDLYEVDEMIVTRYKHTSLREQFEFFAAQKLTNVANAASDISKLNQYYVSQQKVYRLALEETQQKIDSLLRADKQYQAFSKQQIQRYYSNELAITTAKVAKELNVSVPLRLSQTTNTATNIVSSGISTNATYTSNIKRERKKRRYRASIRTTGWKNIDRIINDAVISSVKSRSSTTIKGQKKSTIITYSDYKISVENAERFDKLLVYLVPNEFNSFIRLKAKNSLFTYRLNDLLSYQVYCIGYINEIPFYMDKVVQDSSDAVQLNKITTKILQEKLASISNKHSALETEIVYQASNNTNESTLKKYRAFEKLKEELKDIIFPCTTTEPVNRIFDSIIEQESREIELTSSVIRSIDFSAEVVENAAVFPSCESFTTQTERQRCTSEKIKQFIIDKIDKRAISRHQKNNTTLVTYVSFNIDTLGLVKDVKVRANDKFIKSTYEKAIKALPKMMPATLNGKAVNTKYRMPLILEFD